jgi:hypothetical protein
MPEACHVRSLHLRVSGSECEADLRSSSGGGAGLGFVAVAFDSTSSLPWLLGASSPPHPSIHLVWTQHRTFSIESIRLYGQYCLIIKAKKHHIFALVRRCKNCCETSVAGGRRRCLPHCIYLLGNIALKPKSTF